MFASPEVVDVAFSHPDKLVLDVIESSIRDMFFFRFKVRVSDPTQSDVTPTIVWTSTYRASRDDAIKVGRGMIATHAWLAERRRTGMADPARQLLYAKENPLKKGS